MCKSKDTSIETDNVNTFQMSSNGGNGYLYFKEEALPKLIQTGNKLFQELGHMAMRELLQDTPVFKNIFYYILPLVNSKNNQVRVKASEYFECILQNAVDQKYNPQMKAFI